MTVNKLPFWRGAGGQKSRKTEKDWLYFDLIEVASHDACPVCSLLDKRENRQIDWLFYESVNDPGVREKFRAAGGLCRWHTHVILKQGDALGLSILAADLVSRNGDFSKETADICPLCAAREENEKRVVKAFAGYLRLPEFWEALEKSPGVCRRHFGLISAQFSDKALSAKFADFEKQKLSLLASNLAEIIRKNDYRFQAEKISEDEAKAIRIAWEFLRK